MMIANVLETVRLLMKIQDQTKNSANSQDIVNYKLCLLLQTLIDSFDNKTLLIKYHENDHDDSDDNESDLKTNDVSNENECRI